MRKNELRAFILVCVLPLVILLSLTIMPMLTIMFGTEIRLATQPFDPRDVFRGDHVMLSYQIDELPACIADDSFKSYSANGGETLYVTLQNENGVYEPVLLSASRPAGQLYIKGKFQHASYGTINMSYGLDQYFVKENTGTELEELSRQGKLTARVKVWNGYAYLVGVGK